MRSLPSGWIVGFNVETDVRHPPGFEALAVMGRRAAPGRWFGGDAVMFGLGWDAEMPWSVLPQSLMQTRPRGHRVWTFTWFGLCLILCRGAW